MNSKATALRVAETVSAAVVIVGATSAGTPVSYAAITGGFANPIPGYRQFLV